MNKRKVIQIIKEEEVEEYQLQKINGYDYLNLQETNFEPSIWNAIFGRGIDVATLIKKPHRIKEGDIVLIDDTLNVIKVIKERR